LTRLILPVDRATVDRFIERQDSGRRSGGFGVDPNSNADGHHCGDDTTPRSLLSLRAGCGTTPSQSRYRVQQVAVAMSLLREREGDAVKKNAYGGNTSKSSAEND
jgi:hypothetical protein